MNADIKINKNKYKKHHLMKTVKLPQKYSVASRPYYIRSLIECRIKKKKEKKNKEHNYAGHTSGGVPKVDSSSQSSLSSLPLPHLSISYTHYCTYTQHRLDTRDEIFEISEKGK